MSLRSAGVAALVVLVGLALFTQIGGRGPGRGPATDFTPPSDATPPRPSGDLAGRMGVMLSTSARNRFFVPQELGVTWARANLFMGKFTGTCPVCELYERAGLDLVLTLFNSPGASVPSVAPEDLEAYAQQVGEIIDAVDPEVVAIENEQQNPHFFDGTPEQYGDMLAVACRVAHEKGIGCTDGGLSAATVRAVVYRSLLEQSDAAAEAYAQGAVLSEGEFEQVIDPGNENLLALAEKGSALLSTYRGAGADYVNFHWYYPDPAALRTTIDYLEERTGLPAVTNEIGQVTGDPSTVVTLLDEIADAELPFAIWFSIDIDGRYHQTIGLANPDGSLRPNGLAFRNFLARAG